MSHPQTREEGDNGRCGVTGRAWTIHIPQQFGTRIGLGRLCLSVSKSSDTRGPEVSVMGLKEWLVFLSWSMLTWPRTHRW